ncbi:MAG: insulinase family protein [Alphaproteobacteria bacterium]|nr:insulinase family protein [Alphaproteobacteria bacterium]
MSDLKITTLENGLQIVTDPVPSVESVALGVWVGVGTRNESPEHNGAAHMVEHMLFKGTKKRNAAQIVEIIEDVGGHMNAYTSRELSSYHIHLLKDDIPLALDVLGDIIQNSTMPEDEIDRERGVILQEIGMCFDTPDDIIFDNFYETAYPKQSFGSPILGKSHIIQSIQRDSLMGYVREFYCPKNMVICASGNIDSDEFITLTEQTFSKLPKNKPIQRTPSKYEGGEHREPRELEQSHIVLGFQGISRNDKDFHAARLLSTILGGGMSSRLFQEIREKRGLVYSIYSYHSAFSDGGQFGIYAGTGPDKLKELVPVVCDEVTKLGSTITKEELNRAKAQLRAASLMIRESMMSRADQNAKALILTGKIAEPNDIIDAINKVSFEDLLRTANRIFKTNPTLAALGPLDQLDPYDKIREKLAA